MAEFTGRFENVTTSANAGFILRFADEQILDFSSLEDAKGFLRFYYGSPTAESKIRPSCLC